MILADYLHQHAVAHPDATALRYRDRSYTTAELQAMVAGLAAGLADLSLGKQARIGIMLPNSPAFVTAYIAAGRAGLSVVPINVLYRPDEVRYILTDCSAEVLITAEPFRPLVQALRPHLPNLKHVVMVAEGDAAEDEVSFAALCRHQPVAPAKVSAQDVAVILYTSGTTGHPKGVLLTHRNLLADAEYCTRVLDVSGDDCFVTALPLFHAFAAMVFMVLPITMGARIHLIERFMPAHTLATLGESEATVFGGVPSMFGLMLQVPRANWPDLSPLRICISGGAPLAPEIWTAFEQAFNAKVVEGYGLTEAAPVVAVNPPAGLRKPGSIGPILPGVQYKILDEQGKPVAPGVIGELVIKGDNVMKGYLNRPEDTRQVLRRGWLYTGDLVRVDEDGYLYIVGRKKELIIVGGLNVYPGEVDRVLLLHPAVLEAAAFGMPDPSRGEAVWAAVVLREGQQANEKELQALCREKLAPYKVPRGIVVCDELPKNALGKVVRHQLQDTISQPV
jgi:long-chain acyl-CoA synthetase